MAKNPKNSKTPTKPRNPTPEVRPAPRLYLVTPSLAAGAAWIEQLPDALGAGDIAALLLRLAPADDRTLINRIKALAPIAQEKDVALIVDGHLGLVMRAGADGCHISNVAELESAVSALKPDRILGAGNLKSRHDAMLAAEAGADYLMFGEPAADGTRPSLAAIVERVEWCAELFEVPCVAWAARAEEIGPLVAAGADFIALSDTATADPRGWVAAVADAAALMKVGVLA